MNLRDYSNKMPIKKKHIFQSHSHVFNFHISHVSSVVLVFWLIVNVALYSSEALKSLSIRPSKMIPDASKKINEIV